jgi:hypothetical protein
MHESIIEAAIEMLEAALEGGAELLSGPEEKRAVPPEPGTVPDPSLSEREQAVARALQERCDISAKAAADMVRWLVAENPRLRL